MAWIGLAILLAEALLFFKAYQPLTKRQKQGWNYIYYALLLDVVYAVAVSFTDYSGVIELLWSLVLSALGFYLLFQVQAYFSDSSHKSA